MALNFTNWFKGIKYRLGGSAISNMELPPDWNYQQYLKVYGEVNNGGDMVEHTIRTVDRNVAFSKVHASRGKYTRAEPVSAIV